MSTVWGSVSIWSLILVDHSEPLHYRAPSALDLRGSCAAWKGASFQQSAEALFGIGNVASSTGWRTIKNVCVYLRLEERVYKF
jgi:hypothetical protein